MKEKTSFAVLSGKFTDFIENIQTRVPESMDFFTFVDIFKVGDKSRPWLVTELFSLHFSINL